MHGEDARAVALVESAVTEAEDMLLAPPALSRPPHCRLDHLPKQIRAGDVARP